ncbi:hypothetical protein [Microbacterium sp.]|uniref:hypothetical protein n=1 Tax=Microbacterium sp. TaxID=51671 RepID=UPI0039E709BC
MTDTSREHRPQPSTRRFPSALTLMLAWAGWVAGWALTPGLLAGGVGGWFSDDYATVILIESLVAVVLAVPLVLLHKRFNRVLFAGDRLRWLYALPVVAGIALPFHYGLILPVALYMFWMAVSVFWQDYLTFGLLQSYVRERFSSWAAVPMVAVTFWLGHVLFLPERFGLAHLVPSIAILVLGVVMALLRTRPRSIHLILSLHLTFYYLFA